MAYWIIEDKGFGGVTYKCSNCGALWYDCYDIFSKKFCAVCGEDIDEDANEYIEKPKRRKADDTIVFPQTIGNITFYSKEELFEWVEKQQAVNEVKDEK